MKISTSILDCDNRIDAVLKLSHTNTSYIHIDAMDGNFVPATHFMDINEIKNISRVSDKLLDVHLMMDNPITYIEQLSDVNIEFITIHLEINQNKKVIFSKIKEKGYKVGLSIKPSTDVKEVIPYLDDIDMVLIMSVEPGLGGQKFMNATIQRIDELKELIYNSNQDILIEVDGGINNEIITKLENVDIAVVGSYIVKSDNYNEKINTLLQI